MKMFLTINGILINFAQVTEVIFGEIHIGKSTEKCLEITYSNGKTAFLKFGSNEDAEKMMKKIIETIGAIEL